MKLLLVDDEITIIQILMDAIDWEELGIGTVLTAYNAMSAREIIDREKIDIMICDIEMPKESGLELISWIREQNLNIACIILTAYPDFNYAKDAIDLNVDTYLLKPVVFGELKNVVGRTVSKIEKRNMENDYREYGEDVITDKNKAARVLMQELFYETISINEGSIRREIDKLHLDIRPDEKVSLILFRAENERELKSKGKIVRFAFENIAEELFADIYVYCVEYEPVFMSKGHVSKQRLEEICREYQKIGRDYIKCNLNAYIYYDISLIELSAAFDLLLNTANYLLPGRQEIHFVEKSQAAHGNSREGEEQAESMGRKAADRPEVEKVKEYLEAHYQEMITREDIEKHMHLNGDYLNRIYKSATGFSLMEYIQFLRIEKAKQLLQTTNDTISEICGKTGYDSPPYFSKIFKRQTGKTPSEYREGK